MYPGLQIEHSGPSVPARQPSSIRSLLVRLWACSSLLLVSPYLVPLSSDAASTAASIFSASAAGSTPRQSRAYGQRSKVMLSRAQGTRQYPARLRTSRRRARSGQYPPRGHGLHAWFRRSGSESSKNSSVEAQSSGVVHSAWFLVQVECVSKWIEGEACARTKSQPTCGGVAAVGKI